MTGLIYEPIGNGSKVNLRWAREECNLATAKSTNSADNERHRTQAVLNAKRAVDCMLSELIRRDWLDLHLRERAQLGEKVSLLRQHPYYQIPQTLISDLIARLRNLVEHEFKTPSLEDTKLVVEAAESVASRIEQQVDPLSGHAFQGWYAYASESDKEGTRHYFHGFVEPFALTLRQPNGNICCGVGMISNETAAEILWCNVQDLSIHEHWEMVRWWGPFGATGSASEGWIQPWLACAGITGPVT